MWPNLVRKTEITTTFNFAAEEESVWKRKKQLSVNSTGHSPDACFL